jgi:hypothetical protein
MPNIPAAILDLAISLEGSIASRTPHLVQISAFGSVSCPQFWQNLFPLLGGTPHAGHTSACSATSFPQFLQYI